MSDRQITITIEHRRGEHSAREVLGNCTLATMERALVEAVVAVAESRAEAAALLGIDRHKMKRLMVKLALRWPARFGGFGTAADD